MNQQGINCEQCGAWMEYKPPYTSPKSGKQIGARYVCTNAECVNDQGYPTSVWVPKPKPQRPVPQAAPAVPQPQRAQAGPDHPTKARQIAFLACLKIAQERSKPDSPLALLIAEAAKLADATMYYANNRPPTSVLASPQHVTDDIPPPEDSDIPF